MKKLLMTVVAGLATTLVPLSAFAVDSWPGWFEGNGTDRYMLIPNDEAFDIPQGGVRTISLKVKVNAVGEYAMFTNRVRRYENNQNGDVSGACFYTTQQTNSKTTSVSINHPGSSWDAHLCYRSSNINTTDGWVYLCWVYSSTTSKLYIVNESATVTSSSISSYSTSFADLAMPSYCDPMVGAQYKMVENTKFSINNLTNFLNGNIDNLRIYNAALTADEVISDRASDTPLSEKNLIAAYNFDSVITNTDGSLSISDISGNGHDGALKGTWGIYEETKSTISINAPAAEEGTLKVYNGDTELTNGSTVTSGTNLRIVATPTDEYLLSSVTVNDTQISPNTDGEYIHNVTAESVNISASFISKQDFKPVITFADTENGSFKVSVDGTDVANGDKLPYESKVTITPSPASYAWKVSTITVNGDEIAADDNGAYTFTLTEDATIAATFATKYKNESKDVTTNMFSNANRSVYEVSLGAAVNGVDNAKLRGSVTLPEVGDNDSRNIWQDKTDQVIKVCPGDILTIKVKGKGADLGEYLYIDWNNNGIFEYEAQANTKVETVNGETNELVSYNMHRFSGSSTFYNSNGDPVERTNSTEGLIDGPYFSLPTFKVPSDKLGKYYARFKIDWVNYESYYAGQGCGGEMIDFVIEVVEQESSTPVLTYSQPTGGSLEVKDANGNAIASGTEIAEATALTIVATPDRDHLLGTVTANGTALEANEDGTYSYTTSGYTTIAATFTEKYAHYDASATVDFDRGTFYINKIKFSDANTAEEYGTVTISDIAQYRKVYQDMTDQVINVYSGSNVSVTAVGNGWAMHTYVYIDYNNDGVFTPVISENTATKDSELVTYNYYEGYNSVGSTKTASSWNTPELPTFKIPASLAEGMYRVRYKVDWNNIDPLGSSIIEDKDGEMIDFYINVTKRVREVSVSVPEYSTLGSGNNAKVCGTVTIKENKSTSISTADIVTVEAVPNKDLMDVQFMGWTDKSGNILSKETVYEYDGSIDTELVAHFGFLIQGTLNGSANATISYAQNTDFTDISNKKQSAPALRDADSTTDTTTENINDTSIDLTSGSGSAVLEAGKTAYINASSEGASIRRVYVYSKYTGQTDTYVIDDDANLQQASVAVDIDAPKDVLVVYYTLNTGVEDIAVDAEAEAEYYNLNGVRVSGDLVPGVYIRRAAGKTEKIVIR